MSGYVFAVADYRDGPIGSTASALRVPACFASWPDLNLRKINHVCRAWNGSQLRVLNFITAIFGIRR
jgi:hypothetical protein